MSDAKYERIHAEQDAHVDQDENDFDFIRGGGGVGGSRRSSVHIIENTLAYSGEKKVQTTPTIMQTPSAILALIFIYFGLSISLTFYQRNLLKVITYFGIVLITVNSFTNRIYCRNFIFHSLLYCTI